MANRITWLRMLTEKATYDFDRKQLEERREKLCAGVAVIKVGATTLVELQEKKLRIEGALHAARSAVAEGVVPGRRRGVHQRDPCRAGLREAPSPATCEPARGSSSRP